MGRLALFGRHVAGRVSSAALAGTFAVIALATPAAAADLYTEPQAYPPPAAYGPPPAPAYAPAPYAQYAPAPYYQPYPAYRPYAWGAPYWYGQNYAGWQGRPWGGYRYGY